MGKYLGQWTPPVLWNFTNEQIQNPEKLIKHLKEVCCHSGHIRDGQIMATCWGLAYAYRALLNTIQHLQKEKNAPGSESGVMDSAATPAPSTAATPPPGTSTAATQTSTVMDSAATPAPSTAATPPPGTSRAATQTSAVMDSTATPAPSTAATLPPATSTAATQTTVIIAAAKPEDHLIPIPVAPVCRRKTKKETRKTKQDEETTYSPPGTASDQESSSHDDEEEEEEYAIGQINTESQQIIGNVTVSGSMQVIFQSHPTS
ncbi:hypothetical protein AAES_147064 [Amazona aestiva]|uniref:Uncharacterized protein n=1 Tax=Amazona aestiva TaxID=12930 RepID=A0A0Q3LXE4_AMAAE|nr:hypothetical protein AAES_147064 [Amazona aestiva]